MTIERIKTYFVLKPEEEVAIKLYGLGQFKTELSLERVVNYVGKALTR